MSAEQQHQGWFARLRQRLFEHVDNSTIAAVRIGFGAVLTWHFALMIATGHGWDYYQGSFTQLTYPGFEWMVRLPEPGMMVCLWGLLVCSALIAVGLFFRVAIWTFLVLLFYLHFHDVSAYQNPDYLSLLYGFWLALSPANGRWSLDAKFFENKRTDTTPRWVPWMLRFQIGVAYFYGGIVKFNSDWLGGEPVRTWLHENAADTIFGPGLAAEPVVMFFAWSGLFFDLTIPLWLLIPATRAPAMAGVAAFHLLNEHIFEVGVLPFLMIVATSVFLPHDFLTRFGSTDEDAEPVAQPRTTSRMRQRLLLGLMAFWVVSQLLIPLRHHLYPGDGRWTYEGQRFSWWWRHGQVDVEAKMYVEFPDGRREKIHPPDYLLEHQYSTFMEPHRTVQFAHFLADRVYAGQDVKMYADVKASLNKRPMQQMIPPDVNLLDQPITIAHYDWIVPLKPKPE